MYFTLKNRYYLLQKRYKTLNVGQQATKSLRMLLTRLLLLVFNKVKLILHYFK